MSLTCSFLGLKLRSPILVGSGQHTGAPGLIEKSADAMAENGWAGLVTKTLTRGADSRFNVYPHLWASPAARRLAMVNCGPPHTPFDEACRKSLKKDAQAMHERGLVLIASFVGREPEEWAEHARMVEDAGVDGIELNLSCPAQVKHLTEKGGHRIGQRPDLSAEVVGAVTQAVSIPVSAKLTFHVDDISRIARVCVDAGAKSVSAINTILGIAGIDLNTYRYASQDVYGNSFVGGISGQLIRPFGLYAVAEIVRKEDLEVCGIGGISSWEHVAEYLLVGASAVQVCTAVMQRGFGIGK